MQHQPIQNKHIQFPAKDKNGKPQTITITNKVLGRGAFGQVQFGFDTHDPKKVYAVKCLDKDKLSINPKNLSNLTNEIVIMSDIRSPYVVALLNATKTSKNFYLAMELCNGGDLENFVKQRGGYLKEQEARLILRQIVQGIAAIKSKDVMHRDLKLPNIMMQFSRLPADIHSTNAKFDLNAYIRKLNF